MNSFKSSDLIRFSILKRNNGKCTHLKSHLSNLNTCEEVGAWQISYMQLSMACSAGTAFVEPVVVAALVAPAVAKVGVVRVPLPLAGMLRFALAGAEAAALGS